MKDSITKLENRVAIYNRCSTEEDAQINALEIQAAESVEIAQKMGWTVVVQYIESESGTAIKKRLEYKRLMEDMEKNRFDIIMIKSIDRLMRSTKDWYLFIDKVVTYNLRLYIYIDNKFYDTEDSLITGIKAILAEDFSRELSKKIKNAHKRRQEKKLGLNITVPIFGWDKVEKDTYIINEEEAFYYRLAFAMAYQGKGFYSIAKYMMQQGVVSKKTGKPMSEVQWRKMIYSPRAHGTVVLHTREYDFNTKKYIRVDEKDWIYVENALPPIISLEEQENILNELKQRKKKNNYFKNIDVKTQNCKMELAGKLICGCCGKKYYRTSYKKEGYVWKCSNKIQHGITTCNNINLFEENTMQMIENILHIKETKQRNGSDILEETLRMIRKVLKNDNTKARWKKLQKELKEQERKKELLLEKLLKDIITDQEFTEMNHKIICKIQQLAEEIKEMERNMEQSGNAKERLEKIREYLQTEDILRNVERRMMLEKVEHIIVERDGNLKIQECHRHISSPT